MLGSYDPVTRQLVVHTSRSKRSSDFLAHLEGLAAGTDDPRPRHRDLDRSERAAEPSPAVTVPVTVTRRDTAPMPALVAAASQGRGRLLLDQLFDEDPDPIPDCCLDRVGPSFPQKQRRLFRRRRAIRRHGVISPGAATPVLAA